MKSAITKIQEKHQQLHKNQHWKRFYLFSMAGQLAE